MKNHYLFLLVCGLFFVGTPLFAQKTVVFKSEEKKAGISEEINQLLRDYEPIHGVFPFLIKRSNRLRQ